MKIILWYLKPLHGDIYVCGEKVTYGNTKTNQYIGCFTQMGFIVFLLIFGGILSQEISKGTLIIVLAKGLSRHAVILFKYLVSLILWTISLCMASITNYGYTVYLFGETSADYLIFSLFCLWLFGAFVLALIILSNTLTTGNYGGLLLIVAVLGMMLLLNIPHQFKNIIPHR